MGVFSPLGKNLRYWFRSLAALLAPPPPAEPWTLILPDGTIWGVGNVNADGEISPHPLRQGLYLPFSALDESTSGYVVNSGAALISEVATGLQVAMTASTSWQVTIAAVSPTTGAYFLLSNILAWVTMGVPTAPNDGDEIWIRSATDASNYSQVSIRYLAGSWRIYAIRVVATVETEGHTVALTLGTDRIFGAEYTMRSTVGDAFRLLQASLFTSATGGVEGSGKNLSLSGGEDVTDPANTQTLSIGGSMGAGASWTVVWRGLAVSEHTAINQPLAPF